MLPRRERMINTRAPPHRSTAQIQRKIKENKHQHTGRNVAAAAATVQLPAFASCALNKMIVFIYFIVCVLQSTYSFSHISIVWCIQMRAIHHLLNVYACWVRCEYKPYIVTYIVLPHSYSARDHTTNMIGMNRDYFHLYDVIVSE